MNARGYAGNWYREDGSPRTDLPVPYDEGDELGEITAYQKRIARENMRRFGHPLGEAAAAAAERVRFEADAVSTWLSDGGA